MTATRTIVLTFEIAAPTEAELYTPSQLMDGISHGLPQAWWDPDDGDVVYLTQVTAGLDPPLSKADLDLILAALDSHEYWQLTDDDERDSGASMVPDGKDPDLDACRELQVRLHQIAAGGGKADT